MDSPHVGGLGGTYGGNPIACRSALAVLEIFEEENLLEKAEILGKKIKEQLTKWQKDFKIVGNTRGIGSMMGFELIDKKTGVPASENAKELVNLCFKKGLVVITCGKYGNVIRMLMPLVITDDELEKGFNIIVESLQILTEKT